MAKVYAFPVKKDLPEHLKERLNEIAKLYVKLMSEVYEEMVDDISDEKEVGEFAELMLYEYISSVEKAIAELDEG